MKTQIIDIGRGEVIPPTFINRRSYKFARFFFYKNGLKYLKMTTFCLKLLILLLLKKEGVKSFPGLFRKMKISLYDN